MKIAVFSGEIPSTTFIENLIKGVADRGHTVLLFGRKDKDVHYKQNNIKIYPTPGRLISLLLFVFRYSLVLWLKNKADYRVLGRVMNSKKLNTPQKRLFFLGKALPIIVNKPDIFHIQWIKGCEEWLFLKEFGIKLIGSFRGAHINYSPIIDSSVGEAYRKAFPAFDVFHAVSEAIAEEATKYNAQMDRIEVIPGAVSPELLTFEPVLPDKKCIKFLSVGRFHWKKGYNFALEACKILKDQGISFQYTIVGGVGEEDIPFQRIDLGLEDEVVFIDRLPHEKVIEKFRESHLYLLPSVEEGIANVVLEAMALGVPVVSTDCGGMAEVIENRKNGWVVPVRDPMSIANAVKDYLSMPDDELLQLIAEAKKTIKRRHVIPHQMDKMVDLYEGSLRQTDS